MRRALSLTRAIPLLLALAACGQDPPQPTVTSLSADAQADLLASVDAAPADDAAADPDAASDADTALEPPPDVIPDAIPDAPDTADTEPGTPDADAARPPDAKSGCIVSADCPGAKALCLKGTCVAQQACQSDKQCAALGQVCETAKGVCVPCTTAADCAKGESCKANQCIPPPAPCQSSKDCQPGQVCDKGAKLCVECVTSADCDKGLQCQDTVCAPQACLPGASKCGADGSVQTCKADGSGLESKPCPKGAVCAGDGCKLQVCIPGTPYCNGTQVMACDATGTAPTPTLDCLAISKEKSMCQQGKCVPVPVGQPNYVLRGGFQSVADVQGGGYRVVDQGWLVQQVCGGGVCLRAGFQH